MDFTALIQTIPALAKLGAGFAASQKEYPYPAGMDQAMQALANANAYTSDAMNPNSANFKNVAEGERLAGRLSLIDAIRTIVRQNNVAAAKGIGPVSINPERRDETVWRALTRGYMDNQVAARNRAREFLLNAARASRQNAAGYSPMMVMGDRVNAFNRASSMGGTNALLTGIERFAKVLPDMFGESDNNLTKDRSPAFRDIRTDAAGRIFGGI